MQAVRFTVPWPADGSGARRSFTATGHGAAEMEMPEAALPAQAADMACQLGLTRAALGNVPAAIVAFRQAAKLNPNMHEPWRELAVLLAASGDRAGARAARASAAGATVRARPAPAPDAAQIRSADNDWAKRLAPMSREDAEFALRVHLGTKAPADVAALRHLAMLLLQDNDTERAAPLFRRALAIAPDYLEACRAYAGLLMSRMNYADALPCLQKLAAAEPDRGLWQGLLALCLSQTGSFADAIEHFANASEAFDTHPELLLSYADALKYAGRRDDSVTILRLLLEADAGFGMAWWNLANVKTEAFTDADLHAMRAQLALGPDAKVDRVPLHYALGRALELAGDYAGSFAAYAQGAALKRATLDYDDSGAAESESASQAFFTRARFAATAGMGCPDPAPIFVVGLPRAGTTLVEQILASHSLVEGTMELPEMAGIVRAIVATPTGHRYPDCLADFDAEEIAAFGARYIERTRIYRHTDRPFFIDKMPSNRMHACLIHTILPNAKIIDVRRQAMASCVSAFKMLFGPGVDYSYDLAELGRYYKTYQAHMAHVHAVLPGRVFHVQYENLVNDTETEIRALLDYCGLDFEPACLRFWETGRAVATPSAEQVRQPIFREGLDHWRHYEPWLGPLKQALA
jgi:tetratricopeptide (TPR) repeat protein